MRNILLIIIVVVFMSFPAFATQEIFVLYSHANGEILGSGRIDRIRDDNHRDGSTTLEFIERKLSDGVSVLYLPNGRLPNPDTQKVESGKIKNMTKQEIADLEAAKPKTELELLTERVKALEAR